MRIVHCEDFFHPDAGYQLNILARYMRSKGHEVIVLTSELTKMPSYLTDFFGLNNINERDRSYAEETGVKIIRLPIMRYLSGRSIYYPGYFKKLDALLPDVAFIHGEDTYLGIRCLWRLKKFPYPILFDDHMVDIASRNPLYPLFRKFYRAFMAPIINKSRLTVIRTHDDDFIFKHYGITRERGPYIGFGSNLQLFHPDIAAGQATRAELGIASDEFVAIYAGKLDESKGGLLLAEAVKERFPVERKLAFLVVGNTAAVDGSYAERVEASLSVSKNKIVRLPTQPYGKLNRYFQCADIAVFPKQCSLTFFDTQACGLPVVMEDNDINIARAAHSNGLVFKSGDVEDFRAKITMMAEMPDGELQAMKESAERFILDNYNYDDIAEQYLDVVMRVAQEHKRVRK